MCPSFCWRGQLALFLELPAQRPDSNTKRVAPFNQEKKKKKTGVTSTQTHIFSQLPVWGSYNNEPYAGPKFLQTLQQNGQHKQTFPPAPVPAPQTTLLPEAAVNRQEPAKICRMNGRIHAHLAAKSSWGPLGAPHPLI